MAPLPPRKLNGSTVSRRRGRIVVAAIVDEGLNVLRFLDEQTGGELGLPPEFSDQMVHPVLPFELRAGASGAITAALRYPSLDPPLRQSLSSPRPPGSRPLPAATRRCPAAWRSIGHPFTGCAPKRVEP
jgi:hypothetical protein